VTRTVDPERASAERGGRAVVLSIKSNVPKGTAFVRYCKALVLSRGSRLEAIEIAKQWRDSTPEVELALKAAVPAGTTTDATWAGPLAPITPLFSEFLEYLRAATILDRVPNMRHVPFNVSVSGQTQGGAYQWVGQTAPKPLSKLAFNATTLGIAKCSGIIVISEELARVSTPSAEDIIRRDMVNGIAQFLDVQFTDPTMAPIANVSPGSITNGLVLIPSAGPTPANARTDILALAKAMTQALFTTKGAVLLMSETNALALAMALNPLGQPLFPGMTAQGGVILGFPALASENLGQNVVMVNGEGILIADDGGVEIDVSREASVQMDGAPDNPALATTILTSLWQNNLVGLRADRFINWKRARAGSVQYTQQTYAAS
jgi:HK97 family phage major capsid protein